MSGERSSSLRLLVSPARSAEITSLNMGHVPSRRTRIVLSRDASDLQAQGAILGAERGVCPGGIHITYSFTPEAGASMPRRS